MSYKCTCLCRYLFHTLFIFTVIVQFNHLGKVFLIFCAAAASPQEDMFIVSLERLGFNIFTDAFGP